jgi:hypothetical protein
MASWWTAGDRRYSRAYGQSLQAPEVQVASNSFSNKSSLGNLGMTDEGRSSGSKEAIHD